MRGLTQKEFKAKVKETNPNIEILGTYKNQRTKIAVRCNDCGREWEAWPQHLTDGHTCTCKRKRKNAPKPPTPRTEELLAELEERFPTLKFDPSVKTVKDPFEAHCEECGNTWTTSLERLAKTHGCAKCNKNHTSIAEQFLYVAATEALPHHTIVNRDHDAIGQELDIYDITTKKAIEFGTWHWHKAQIEIDIAKEAICKAEGIELLTIYEHTDNDIDIKPKRSYCLKHQAKKLPDLISLAKTTVHFLAPASNIEAMNLDWEAIYETATENAFKRTAKAQFEENMQRLHPTLEVLGPYVCYHASIEVRCKTCGHIWLSTPARFITEHLGCPKCAHAAAGQKRAHTPDDYAKALKVQNPDLEIVSTYTGAKENIKVKCTICGTQWTMRADALLATPRCPNCEGKLPRKKNLQVMPKAQRRRIESLQEIIRAKGSHIEVEGAYAGDDVPITCRCTKCGHTFTRTPKNLRRHYKCPACEGKQSHIRYTDKTFKAKMKDLNPNIEITGTFVKQAQKVACKCNICGHTWEATPNKLLQGRSCPKCAAKVRSAAGVEARKKNAKERNEIKYQ